MATYDELMEGARKAHAAGDTAGAKRFLELARDSARQSDGQYATQPMSNDPAAYTSEQYREAAKKALAAGDVAAAKRLIARGRAAESANKSWGQWGREQLFGDNDPSTMNAGEKLGTLLNMGGNALTFGIVGDEAAAAADSLIGRGNYDDRLAQYRGNEASVRESNPGASLAADVLPALAAPFGALGTGGKLGARMLKSGLATGALSGVAGFANAEGGAGQRLQNAYDVAPMGAVIGGAIPIAGSALQGLMQNRMTARAIKAGAKNAPSSDELRAMGNAAYQQVDNAGVQIAPQAFDRARGTILDDLRANTGFDELPGPGSLTPYAARASQIMGEASARMGADPTAALPFKALDQMRRQAGAAAGNVTNKTDQQAGMRIIEGLDDFVKNLGPGDVVAGDIAALNQAIPKARETWSRMTKSQTIDNAIEAGGNYTSGASSGIRNQFAAILRDKKAAARFTEGERAAMRRVVNGSIPEQLLNLASGGMGQIAQTFGGGAAGGIPGAFAGAGAAAGTRKLAEGVTRRKAETVRGLVANAGLQNLPQASTALRDLLESRLRLGTAAMQGRP